MPFPAQMMQSTKVLCGPNPGNSRVGYQTGNPFSAVMTNCCNPAKLWAMVREISAGGVVVRKYEDAWTIAVIEPQKEPSPEAADAKSKAQKAVYALPKGIVDPGEKPEQTAVREVREETGIESSVVTKLADIKYVYVRTWSDKERVFKIVSFYLLRYEKGRIDDVTDGMRIEVKRASWLPLANAEKKLSYSNERKIIRLAQQYLEAHPEF
jgi:8-oxo-dGTP pyrophosphatase MutT (NUDIX family)